MKNKPNTLLLHPLFLFSVLLLAVNDLYFKHTFHNLLTGKLSDFAGLFACFVFLISLFPSGRNILLIALVIAFVWWKSPLSESFILFMNTQLNIPVHRVVDYSDYIALIILPLAFYIKPTSYAPSLPRQVAIGCIGAFSLSVFVADSLPRG